MSLCGRCPLGGGRVSRGDHKSGMWPGEGNKSMSLYSRSTLTREHGGSICVWSQGHKLITLCGRYPFSGGRVSRGDHKKWYMARRGKYSGTRLTRTPKGHAIVSVLSGCPY